MAARFHPLTLLVVLELAVPSSASAEEKPAAHSHCDGWAFAGAFAGGAIGSLGALGALHLSGVAIDDPANFPRRGVAQFLGVSLGMTFMPVATCALFGDEPHVIPAASFVVGGAFIGAAALVGAFVMIDQTALHGRVASMEGGALLFFVAGAAGLLLGGWGGYALHLARELPPSAAPAVAVFPVMGPDQAGLGVRATF